MGTIRRIWILIESYCLYMPDIGAMSIFVLFSLKYPDDIMTPRRNLICISFDHNRILVILCPLQNVVYFTIILLPLLYTEPSFIFFSTLHHPPPLLPLAPHTFITKGITGTRVISRWIEEWENPKEWWCWNDWIAVLRALKSSTRTTE